MDKAPKFKYVPEASSDVGANCPIKIMEGKYNGIVYRYGKISFQELEDGSLNVNMEVEMISAPEGFNQQEPEFTETVGNIFTKIIEDQVTTEEKDLEADVHED